jgi:hypothetical protein
MDDKNVSENLSNLTNAITQILKAVGCPTGSRHFIDGLVSVSGGSFEIQISDKELADKVRTETVNVTKEAQEKWTQRHRKALEDWQKQSNITLVEVELGGKNWTQGSFFTTKYKLPIQEYARKVIAAAQGDAEQWEKNRNKAIEEAAIALVATLDREPAKDLKRVNSSENYIKQIKTARTILENALATMKKYDSGIHGEDAELLDEIEKVVTEMRAKVGYFGEWSKSKVDRRYRD